MVPVVARPPLVTLGVPLWPAVLPRVTVPDTAPGALMVAGLGDPALLMLTAVPEPGMAAGFQFPVVNQSAETVPSQSAATAGPSGMQVVARHVLARSQ